MIRLTTFGGLVLRDAKGRSIDCILAQPRRLALLTYLAVETRKTAVRRDVLMGIFWPEVSQSRASRALSQALHFLRKALGNEAFSEPGKETVRIEPHALGCDAAAFLAAIEAGRHADAVDLYAGDFLRGFYVHDAPDFERWAEDQRLYLRRQASESAMHQARNAAADGQPVRAARYAHRATEFGLFAEPLVREQMELLVSVGDYASALEAYRDLRRRLERELECAPSPETDAVATAIRLRSAVAGDNPQLATPLRIESTEPSLAQTPRLRGRAHRRLLAAGIAVVVMGATISAWGLRRPDPGVTQLAPELWIDQFHDAGNTAGGVGKTLTSEVVRELSAVEGISVQQIGSPVTEPRLGTREPIVVRGSVTSTPWLKGYSVTVTLTNGMTGEGIGVREFRYEDKRSVRPRDIANDLVEFARVETGRYQRTRALGDLSPRNADGIRLAHVYRVRGDSLRGDGQAQPALAAFRAADSLLSMLTGGNRTASLAYTERADVWLARAWVFLTPGMLDMTEFQNSAARALLLTDSALRADNRSAEAQEIRGAALQLLWQAMPADSVVRLRRFLEMAERALEAAVDIAPARARSWALLSAVYDVQGRYGEALLAAQRSYAANAFLDQSAEVLHRLNSSALETGDVSGARKWCEEINRRFANNWMATDCRLQTLAWSKPTRTDFREASQLVAKHSATGTHAPLMVARLGMLLGVVAARAGLPIDTALAIQDRALEQGGHNPDLALFRAWMWQAANRADSAQALIRAYVSADPIRRGGKLKSRRFRPEPVIASYQSLQ